MWLAVGIVVTTAGWLLMMVVIWRVLYDHEEWWDERGTPGGR